MRRVVSAGNVVGGADIGASGLFAAGRRWNIGVAPHRILQDKKSDHRQTFNTSPSRATISYSTGFTKNPSSNRESSPATITIANGFCVSDPMPVESAAG